MKFCWFSPQAQPNASYFFDLNVQNLILHLLSHDLAVYLRVPIVVHVKNTWKIGFYGSDTLKNYFFLVQKLRKSFKMGISYYSKVFGLIQYDFLKIDIFAWFTP